MAKELPEEAGGRASTADAMRGVLALLAADRDERAENDSSVRRSELVLADAGLPPQAIADLTGKPKETIRSAVRRAEAKKANAN